MDAFSAAVADPECVQLSQLQPLTTLLVWTRNSFYRFVVMDHPSVRVQGGAQFADPSPAELAGAGTGLGFVLDGLICIGLAIELRAGDARIVTSPVLAISTGCARDSVVH